MDITELLEIMTAKLQLDRAMSQMTLGRLINELSAMPKGSVVANLREPHSYRGYYIDLALEREDGTRPATDLLRECQEAVGKKFHGWKGGLYVMGMMTPVWVANRGESGVKLIAIRQGGVVETLEDGDE